MFETPRFAHYLGVVNKSFFPNKNKQQTPFDSTSKIKHDFFTTMTNMWLSKIFHFWWSRIASKPNRNKQTCITVMRSNNLNWYTLGTINSSAVFKNQPCANIQQLWINLKYTCDTLCAEIVWEMAVIELSKHAECVHQKLHFWEFLWTVWSTTQSTVESDGWWAQRLCEVAETACRVGVLYAE